MPSTEPVSRVKAHTQYRTADGKRVPGVTTILGVINKPALVPWANKLGLQGIDTCAYVDKLAEIGTLAHYWIECLLTDREPDFTSWSQEQQDLAANSVVKFLEWQDEHDIRVIATELPLVSEAYRFGGTLDILAEIDGKLGLIDIKTSKAIYDDHMYQVAAYYQLGIEPGYYFESVRILQVGRSPDEGFSVRHADQREVEIYWKVFEAALMLYNAVKVSKRKRSR